jgi:hypothetical protein
MTCFQKGFSQYAKEYTGIPIPYSAKNTIKNRPASVEGAKSPNPIVVKVTTPKYTLSMMPHFSKP